MSEVEAIIEDIKRLTPAEQAEVRLGIAALMEADAVNAVGESDDEPTGPRDQIRQLLLLREWQEVGDKALAKHVGCNPLRVERERRRLIHRGLIPAGWGYDPDTGRHVEDRPRYRPYAPSRGGYWWTPDGRTVRETSDEITQHLAANQGETAADGGTAGDSEDDHHS